MLKNIKENGQGRSRIYYSKSKYGKPLRSTTIIISGGGGKLIGMLCFNLYLDSPISSFLRGIITENKTDYVNEHFISSSDELIIPENSRRPLSGFFDQPIPPKKIPRM
jgi:predicted transcriptional regulator YheO